jgi:hypothetical protein
MQTGDLIFWTAKETGEARIAELYGYSHVSLVVTFKNIPDVYLAEALIGGLKLRRLENRIEASDVWEKGYKNRSITVWHYKLSGISIKQRQIIKEFTLDELTKDIQYDYSTFFMFLLNGGKIPLEPRKYTCAEFVWNAWVHGGLVLPRKTVPMAKEMMSTAPGKLTQIYES